VLTITIDWLALTAKEYTYEFEYFLQLYACATKVRDASPRNGYNSATEDGNGVVHMWHSDREEMGHHVVFSGSALRHVFEQTAVPQRGLVEAALRTGANITRLDLAKDATEIPIDLRAIYASIEAGQAKGTARSFSQFGSPNGGFTIYVGSRQSEKFIRIYDKAVETNSIGDWKRYELETKGMVARALATLLVERTASWSGAFDDMALGMFDLPKSSDYAKFFSPEQVRIGIPKLEKKSDTALWIDQQVIPAVGKYYGDHPESREVQRLLDALLFIKEMHSAQHKDN